MQVLYAVQFVLSVKVDLLRINPMTGKNKEPSWTRIKFPTSLSQFNNGDMRTPMEGRQFKKKRDSSIKEHGFYSTLANRGGEPKN